MKLLITKNNEMKVLTRTYGEPLQSQTEEDRADTILVNAKEFQDFVEKAGVEANIKYIKKLKRKLATFGGKIYLETVI